MTLSGRIFVGLGLGVATGNQFVVLPQIAENCKTLLREHNAGGPEAESAVDIIVPVSFNFPSLGKLLVLLFVLFAAWFTDTDLTAGDRVSLAFSGLFTLFGSINVAVPYMLDSLQIPADMFQLFLVTGIVVGRFGAMLAALHIIVLAVVGTLALSGGLRFHNGAIARYLLISSVSLVTLIVVLRVYFHLFVPDPPVREEVLSAIQLMEERVPAQMVTEVPEASVTQLAGSRLDHIFRTGILQVGYRPHNLPCSFINPTGALVGFDVEMAHMLAAYPVPKGDIEMMELVSNWIELKRKEGAIETLYNYWMLGGAAQPRQPRWSVIRDVLGWID